jgi:hypothetical protein
MMKKMTFLLLLCLPMISCTPEGMKILTDVLEAGGGTQALTTEQISMGLKEALTNGISKGADLVSKTDGYYKNPDIKLLFPPQAQKVEQKLRDLGLGNLPDQLIEKLNRAAEDAAKEAKPIFVSAIKSMTIGDATNILMGGDNTAATSYLKKTTSDALYQKFNPVITNSLKKVKALDYWDNIITRYNKIPFVEKVNPDLNDYVTNKAMDGLFLMIQKEEGLIRKDPIARTTDLLKKVFAKQDK